MKQNSNTTFSWLGVLLVIWVASNLRSPITAVGPILDEIKLAMNLDNIQASLLTSIPLIVFASCSILVSKATARLNIRHGLIYALLFLIIGLYLRVYGNITTLYIGSVLLGLSICIGNVLTPAYIKNEFPAKIGLMTGIFSVSMNLVAALASGFSISIGKWTGMGWKGSLGIWIFVAIIALIIVFAELFWGANTASQQTKKEETIKFNIFKSKQAWNISLFMGLQSLIYYCLVAFLPSVLMEYGMSKSEAGWVFSILQLAMLPVMLVSPVIASKMKDPKLMIYSIGVLYFSGIVMLILFKTQWIYFTAILLGISGGLAFSLAILFLSFRSKTMAGTIKISGKAQSIGYLIAAFGPPLFGKLHDFDISWKYSFYFLLAIILIMTFFGRKSAKPRFIEDH
ncbi:CynX/NimT family MFS transporter [Sphingobacterium cellulitidis]|uniref:MFS transporter n=1 Tax=Sphingobacterium cellulitidis TaxID=1768011 RepID=A0A8H9FZK5_9SPHI|nr:MFS transporter [Sphingobacterium soli]MBA8985136.1 CP family cyanate transporter-like MFS transporter [Sphingobacterium soli]GGE11994.1 MFS transporter [Sphingobacterium soli]